MNKLKKLLALIMIFTMVSLTVGVDVSVAENLADKQNELNEINDQKDEAKSELSRIVDDIEAKEGEIDEINGNIADKEDEIETTTEKLEKKEQEMTERQIGTESRLRAMYKSGTVGFMDIIFSSDDISDFLTNVEMIKHIYEYDKEVLNQLEDDYNEIQGIKKDLEDAKEELDKEMAAAEAKKKELQSSKQSLEAKIDQFNEDAKSLNSEIVRLQEEAKEQFENGGTISDQGMLWPTTTRYITSYYGWRIHPVLGTQKFHTGIDIGVASGNPVYAVKSGVVILSQYYYGYGNTVIIDHGDGMSTLYAHNSVLKVSKGQWVNQGDTVCLSGNTGTSTGPHLHFEVRINGATVNPLSYY